MRNNSKITTLESKFPLLSVEQGCMVSKDADITVAFRVELPELFTVTSTEYGVSRKTQLHPPPSHAHNFISL